MILCLYVSMYHECAVPTKVRKGCWVPRNWKNIVRCPVRARNRNQVLCKSSVNSVAEAPLQRSTLGAGSSE